jgi:hypothetical protein
MEGCIVLAIFVSGTFVAFRGIAMHFQYAAAQRKNTIRMRTKHEFSVSMLKILQVESDDPLCGIPSIPGCLAIPSLSEYVY